MGCEYTAEFRMTKPLDSNFEKEAREIAEELKKKVNEPQKFSYKISVSGNNLQVHVKSIEKTATNFVLQMDKKIREELGKTYKTGVKELVILDYKLDFETEKEPKEDVSIPFCTSLSIKGRKAELFYKEIDEGFLRKNSIERSIKLIDDKIAKQYYEGKGEYHEILFEFGKKDPIWEKDPTEEMLKKKWLVSGPTKGKWVFRPQLAAIMRTMEKIVINELLEPLGFQEMFCTSVMSGEKIWKRTGHLEGMPMEIYYVAEPKTRNIKEWEPFIDKLKITNEIPEDEFKKMVTITPLQGLTYAQCPVMYWSLEKATISSKDLPLKLFDRAQNSFRYESGGRHGIERVDEFHRIEPIYIGTPDQLIKLREEIMEKYKHIFNDILELEWRTAWVTPFYMQQSGQEFKQDYAQKIQGTIDFEAWLPYRGKREKSEWLEFQNLSIVGEKYTKAFSIKTQKGELWSGCTGIGLERWVVAFLAQHGLDPEKWPKGFKKYLPKLPKEIDFC